jgi:cell wall-active antibiotic response 4TMS protein YvqF
MRIFPLILIAVGVFGVLKHYGLIDPAFAHVFWPFLLIGIGVALLVRGPRWRGGMRQRMQDRWERRMHRHFGPGWANLSEEERERFRAGMRQWHCHFHGGERGDSSAPTIAGDGSIPKPSTQAPAPGEQR